ncbi:hypothetical protein SAMN06295974_1342 [Plantibacter flavus]|uniref:DUF2207 domain-containing protein n=1 Tax=Plantibacter flavus TaxID=150123 RepID=A0A3N2C6X9_9MICO|nr:hypothetical protein [Plantibacter flavus]ROR83275.1 hypothetical protein EDD42_3386 [Plantibacter flavus]SMG22139.1 hypothetical protein SAMN06295974_1342 [Plantibacter flavus]
MSGSDGASGTAAVDPDVRIPDPAPRHTPLWTVLSAWLLRVERWLQSRGGPRLRRNLWQLWGLVAVGGILLLVGPVINPPLTLDDLTDEASDVTDTWIARSFSADYGVTTDEDGRLVTDVEERIDAFFPKDLDDRTIERVLATEYQGHALDPSGITVTLDGVKQDVDRERAAVFLRLVVDPGEQLTGDHELVIRYRLSDLAYVDADAATGRPVDLLRWDVFGPDLQQAVAKLDVRVTIPQELDDRLVRQPRGSLAWTLVGAGQWLTPEPDAPPGEVAYAFTSDDAAPPHAQARFTMPFEAGSITMPPQSWIFWVQTFGPVLPMLVLAATLLLSFAARAVAWGDARGRPWYLAQSEPPEGVTPRTAAHLLRSPATMELAERLKDAAISGTKQQAKRQARLLAAAGAAKRAGRLGDRHRALRRYLTGPERAGQVREGLRRVPKGFVRDWFIAAPIALTILQWGIVRQLSHQAVLAVVWWPLAFVALSTVFAAIVLAIALTARPLTRKGALVKQHLLGIRVFAERTQLLDRATLRDRLLPYAVLGAPPRATGRRVAALLAPEITMPAAAADRASRADGSRAGFLTGPRIAVRVLAVLLVVGAIVAVNVLPASSLEPETPRSYTGDIPGSTLVTIAAAEFDAQLTRSGGDGARLRVTERLGVDFSNEGAVPGQVVREWPAVVDGQDLGLSVDRVTVDGEDAPFTTEHEDGRLLLRTTFDDVRTGLHDVVIQTTATRPAVATSVGGRDVDRVSWVALLDGWSNSVPWDDDSPPEPFRLSFTADDELLDDAVDAGWTPAEAGAWRPAATEGGAGRSTATLDLAPDDDGRWSLDVRGDDLGVVLDLPAGTVAGADAGAASWARTAALAPGLFTVVLAGIAVLGSVIGALGSARRRAPKPGLLRDAVRWLTPSALAAAVILGIWTLNGVAGDDPFGDLVLGGLIAGVVAVIAWYGVVMWARPRA